MKPSTPETMRRRRSPARRRPSEAAAALDFSAGDSPSAAKSSDTKGQISKLAIAVLSILSAVAAAYFVCGPDSPIQGSAFEVSVFEDGDDDDDVWSRPWARGMVLTEWRCRRGRRCLGGGVVRLGGGRMRCAANFSEPILAPRYGRAAAEANFCALFWSRVTAAQRPS